MGINVRPEIYNRFQELRQAEDVSEEALLRKMMDQYQPEDVPEEAHLLKGIDPYQPEDE